MQVLVLTHNILFEETLQKKLQSINHEVFCSTTMLELFRKQEINTLACYFYEIIILSDNLTNQEVSQMLPNLKKTKSIILRKLVNEPSTEEKSLMKTMGIHNWLTSNISEDVLRELISEEAIHLEQQRRNIVSFPVVNLKESQSIMENYKKMLESFSKKEKIVFQKLYLADCCVVSREDFCKYVWEDEPSNSHMSQLSLLIKNIRKKIATRGLPENVIVTEWGQGYRLTQHFFDFFPLQEIERVN